jgi:hypothetical protein
MHIIKQALKAGKQYLIVPNDDGTLGLVEYVPPIPPDPTITDVVYNGKSVVSNGVATIPPYPVPPDPIITDVVYNGKTVVSNKVATIPPYPDVSSYATTEYVNKVASALTTEQKVNDMISYRFTTDLRTHYYNKEYIDDQLSAINESISGLSQTVWNDMDAVWYDITDLQKLSSNNHFDIGQLQGRLTEDETTISSISRDLQGFIPTINACCTSIRVDGVSYSATNHQIGIPNYPANFVKDVLFRGGSLVSRPSMNASIPDFVDQYRRQIPYDSVGNAVNVGIWLKTSLDGHQTGLSNSYLIYRDFDNSVHDHPDWIFGPQTHDWNDVWYNFCSFSAAQQPYKIELNFNCILANTAFSMTTGFSVIRQAAEEDINEIPSETSQTPQKSKEPVLLQSWDKALKK